MPRWSQVVAGVMGVVVVGEARVARRAGGGDGAMVEKWKVCGL